MDAGEIITSRSVTSQAKKYAFQRLAGQALDERGLRQRIFVSEIWTADGVDNVRPSQSDSCREGIMVISSDGKRALTAIMRVERDWKSGAPTVMAPEFDEGDAGGMHPAVACALGLTLPAPVLTDADAAEIAAECVAAIDAQIDLPRTGPC